RAVVAPDGEPPAVRRECQGHNGRLPVSQLAPPRAPLAVPQDYLPLPAAGDQKVVSRMERQAQDALGMGLEIRLHPPVRPPPARPAPGGHVAGRVVPPARRPAGQGLAVGREGDAAARPTHPLPVVRNAPPADLPDVETAWTHGAAVLVVPEGGGQPPTVGRERQGVGGRLFRRDRQRLRRPPRPQPRRRRRGVLPPPRRGGDPPPPRRPQGGHTNQPPPPPRP